LVAKVVQPTSTSSARTTEKFGMYLGMLVEVSILGFLILFINTIILCQFKYINR
jgi:hypothetical protein